MGYLLPPVDSERLRDVRFWPLLPCVEEANLLADRNFGRRGAA